MKRAAPSPRASTKSSAPPRASPPRPRSRVWPAITRWCSKPSPAFRRSTVTTGGQLGKPSSARRRVYERLKDYAARVKDSLFDIKPLHQAIDAIYEAPLTEAARDLLNREMKSGIENEKLVELVLSLHEEDRLCVPQDDVEAREPKIICSLGIRRD